MIIYGKRVFYYILQNHKNIVNEIILSKKLDKKEFSQLQKFNIPIKISDNKKAQAMAKGGNHQGYFLDINFEPKESENIKNLKSVLILDNITDVGNIGAIVRTAYAFGIDTIIVTGLNELKWENIIRSSVGSAIEMPILVIKNILDVINDLKTNGFKIVGADMGGNSSIEKSEKMALIMGSEGEGLSKRVKSKLDEVISIEMKREFDSLNVSVASGILMDRIFNG
jgi:23S rRNA (guanosine2251-2'-O)-methyltransferase